MRCDAGSDSSGDRGELIRPHFPSFLNTLHNVLTASLCSDKISNAHFLNFDFREERDARGFFILWRQMWHEVTEVDDLLQLRASAFLSQQIVIFHCQSDAEEGW